MSVPPGILAASTSALRMAWTRERGDAVGTVELFGVFDQRVTASMSERETAVKRLLDCEAALSARYYANASVGKHLTVIGSAAKTTSVTPMADADGVFRMPVGTHAQFDGYAGNGQSALLQQVRGASSRCRAIS